MKPSSDHKPKFQISSQARLNRYLPPLLSGSIVAILDVRQINGGAYRYQVTSAEYPARPVWACEEDLDYPLEAR